MVQSGRVWWYPQCYVKERQELTGQVHSWPHISRSSWCPIGFKTFWYVFMVLRYFGVFSSPMLWEITQRLPCTTGMLWVHEFEYSLHFQGHDMKAWGFVRVWTPWDGNRGNKLSGGCSTPCLGMLPDMCPSPAGLGGMNHNFTRSLLRIKQHGWLEASVAVHTLAWLC